VSYTSAEQERRAENGAKVATVTAINAAAARAKVSFGGDSESAWLPFMGQRGGNVRVWNPPSVGEQVWVLSESGNTAQGVILGAAFQDAHPAPSDAEDQWEVHVGGSKVIVSGDRILLSSNGSTIELDASGVRINGARIDLN